VIETPTPEGPIELRIPPGSGSGRRLRVRGRGIPASPPGDLYVTLRVVVPPADSERARQLYQRMRDDLAFDPRAAMED
jgi:curved DNA-binding protein